MRSFVQTYLAKRMMDVRPEAPPRTGPCKGKSRREYDHKRHNWRIQLDTNEMDEGDVPMNHASQADNYDRPLGLRRTRKPRKRPMQTFAETYVGSTDEATAPGFAVIEVQPRASGGNWIAMGTASTQPQILFQTMRAIQRASPGSRVRARDAVTGVIIDVW